jgi:hypothetical protein
VPDDKGRCYREELSNCELELKEFASSVVTTKQNYILVPSSTCKFYLKCVIGLSESDKAYDVSKLELTHYNGIHIPPEGYMTLEPLHEDWIEHIPNAKANQLKFQKSQKATTTKSNALINL